MYYKSIDQSINQLLKPIFLVLFLLTIISCQSSPTEPMVEESNISSLQKDPRSPDTYVHGIVYKQGSPKKGATVKLYKGITFLAQTTTDGNGYYELCVCMHHAGTGTYQVQGSWTTWFDSRSFYWNHYTGPWDFEIDLDLSAI